MIRFIACAIITGHFIVALGQFARPAIASDSVYDGNGAQYIGRLYDVEYLLCHEPSGKFCTVATICDNSKISKSLCSEAFLFKAVTVKNGTDAYIVRHEKSVAYGATKSLCFGKDSLEEGDCYRLE